MGGLQGIKYRWLTWSAIALLILAVMITGARSETTTVTATVDYAKSGNTLELLWPLTPESPVTTLRLEGIQAPDAEQTPWGNTARNCLKEVREQIVRVESDDWTPDAHNRLWAYVWNGKTLLNVQLLEQGCAYIAGDRLPYGHHTAALIYAQEKARLLGLGIWNPETPLRETAKAFRRQSDAQSP
ncbi:thermonuclease family protein [Oscillatoria sp. CS-180]|uniref:thermonuclease family protein n=1 Tax=Oscillatoria sp. CS-180 TaxID=3021720 RepID=UPI002330C4AF|nr:thermonuclease family protein [Oscillatoria sp. CS-180]MDB9527214.1 thermonuclease family protein [Oscillatoria sp. CS-180]